MAVDSDKISNTIFGALVIYAKFFGLWQITKLSGCTTVVSSIFQSTGNRAWHLGQFFKASWSCQAILLDTIWCLIEGAGDIA